MNITIIGSGVVGKATGLGFLKRTNNNVTFVDVSEDRINKLKADGLTAMLFDSDDYKNSTSDITIFTVPTPTENNEIDLSYMDQASKKVAERYKTKNNYEVFVVRSTVLPGTTRNLVVKNIESITGKKLGSDFGACMNPEYLREESSVEDFEHPRIILIGGADEKSTSTLKEIYTNFGCDIESCTLEEAELQKYIHNLYNATKISFFNEFRMTTEAMPFDVDIQKLFNITVKSAEGLWNAKYGTKYKGPYDGKCLPKDTSAFLTYANKKNIQMPVLKATIDVNNEYKISLGLEENNIHDKLAL